VTDKLGLVGTPSYMSPEQVQGDILTPQSDLFSCGIVACELFLNIHPFLGRDINESLNAIISFDEEKFAERLQPLPEDIRNVIGKLLKKKPNQRWENASAVLEALGVSIDTDLTGKPDGQSRRFFRPLTIAAMVAVVLLGTLMSYLIRHNNSEVAALLPAASDTSGTGLKKPDTVLIASSERDTMTAHSSPKKDDERKRMENRSAANVSSHKKDTTENITPVPPVAVRYGELSVACLPWALISIDSVDMDTTPLKSNLRLPVGAHELKLSHPQFPIYRSRISILPDEVTAIKINLDTLFGFLAFNVYPWGEVYIDGRYVDRTPFKPCKLVPGAYRIKIKNAELGAVEKQVTVKQHDTLWIQHRFGLLQ
jgi:serine/threonine-protein kinase